MEICQFSKKISVEIDKTIHSDTSNIEKLTSSILQEFSTVLHDDIGERLSKYDDEYCNTIRPKHVKVVRCPQTRTVQAMCGTITFKRRTVSTYSLNNLKI